MAEETVILKVQLDENKTEDRVKALVLAIDATKRAQSDLNVMRKNGLVADEEYASQSVKLSAQLKNQRTEQTSLTKNLELYRTATGDLGNTYEGMQAQLSLAQRQFKLLDGSADNSSESAQALGKTIDELRNTLKATDETQSLFVRNIGNYPKGEEITPLIQQLIKLQEAQKHLTEGSADYQKVEQAVIGFQQRVSQAGAKAGLSYEQTEAKLKEYGEAVRPAISNLVQLEREQTLVGETGSDAFRKIGFQIAAAQKQVEEVPTEIKGVGDAISELDETTNVFGGRVGELKQKFTQAKQGVEVARVGFVGLKGAIAATGIGLLVLTLFALYEAFTKTDEGQEDLAAGLAFLKGGLSVVEGVVISLGSGLIRLFKEPQAALGDLGDLIKENLINRLESVQVLYEAIRDGDLSKLGDGIVQATTGITNATEKSAAFTSELKRAAAAAYEISRAQDELDNMQRENLVTVEKNKNLIDKLVLSARDRTLSERERLANLDKAGKLEEANLALTVRYATERLRIQRLQNAEAIKTGKIQDDELQAEQEALAEVVRLQGQSESLQQSIRNRRSVLLQAEAAENKAARAKEIQEAEKQQERLLQLRREGIQLDLLNIERRLRGVAEGSTEEISLLQQKLLRAKDLELAQAKLTVGQKKLIEEKYQQDSDKLLEDSIRRRGQIALQVEAQAIAARLATVRQGSAEELKFQQEQIEKQRQQNLAAIAERATEEEKASQTRLINATAEKQQNDLLYADRIKAVQTFYQQERNLLEEARANGQITEQQYRDTLFQLEIGSASARKAVNQQFNRDTAADDQALTDAKIRHLREYTDAERAAREDQLNMARDFGAAIGDLFAETVNDTGLTLQDFAAKTLLILVDSLEKAVLAATVEATAKTVAALPFPLGLIAAAGQVAIIKGAFGAVKGALSQSGTKQFAQGTVLGGAYHEQGGVQLFDRRTGRHFGEAEKNEIILTRGVFENKELFAAASALNVAGGGKALAPARFMDLGGVASSYVRESLAGPVVVPIDYDRLADALRQVPLSVGVRDTMAAEARRIFTEQNANA